MDPTDLEGKAREFLDKNYKKLKQGEPLRTEFMYILEPKSINGMAKFQHVQRDPRNTKTEYGGVKSYTTFENKPNRDDVYDPILKSTEIWYRPFYVMGNSASSKRFGGRRRKKRTKRKNNY